MEPALTIANKTAPAPKTSSVCKQEIVTPPAQAIVTEYATETKPRHANRDALRQVSLTAQDNTVMAIKTDADDKATIKLQTPNNFLFLVLGKQFIFRNSLNTKEDHED